MERFKTKKHIIYDDLYHSYKNTNNEQFYTSVTRWISSIKEPFKADRNSTAFTERKLRMTHEEVLAMWDKKNKISTIRGHNIHKYIECLLLGIEIPFDIEAYLSQDLKDKIVAYLVKKKLLNKLGRKKLHVEEIVFNDTTMLAGQADLPIEYKNHFIIKDWKTNEKTYAELQKSYSKYKAVFTEVDQCSLFDYYIQLTIYALFIEVEFNKPVKELHIVHIFNDIKEYKVPPVIFEYIKNKLKQLWNL